MCIRDSYYIDRQIIKNKGVDDMTEEEIEEKLKSIEDQYGYILNTDEGGKNAKKRKRS